MSRDISIQSFEIGDRVTRPSALDDGTWARLGDTCLPDGPLLHGVVVAKTRRSLFEFEYDVQWDGAPNVICGFLSHGLDPE